MLEYKSVDSDNELLIGGIFSEKKEVLGDMIKDLLNIYQKDIVIYAIYSDYSEKNKKILFRS